MSTVFTVSDAASNRKRLTALMMAMFFAFGFCTVLVDTLVPKLKSMFSLSYTEVMLTQFAYFGAYFVVSIPAGWLLSKIGYLQGIVAGLIVMAIGAFGFIPAAWLGVYPAFLLALFLLAAGVTIVQVAANPVTALSGQEETAPSRLTLAQAFNSVATMVGPLFGAYFILSTMREPPATTSPASLALFRQGEVHVFIVPFTGIAAILVGLALICWVVRRWSPPATLVSVAAFRRLLGHPRLTLGALSIFTYVGAEVSIGSSLVNYLMQGTVLGVAAITAGRLLSLYWGGAMVGRFAGAAVLRVMPPGAALVLCALVAALLATLSALSGGLAAAAAVLAIGLFNSIMFPTIFTLAIGGLGDDTPEASGIICLAIVGGAVIPVLSGMVADRFGLSSALFVPVVCYLWVACYGVMTWTGLLGLPANFRG